MRRLPGIVVACVAGAAAGCGSDADIAGSYVIATTNRDNGCDLGNFTPGTSATNIQVVITQEGSAATLTVNGLAAIALDLVLGNHAFTGEVDGDEFALDSIGTVPQIAGNCTYTFNSTIFGVVAGDAVSGRIEYRAADNGNSDCAQVAGCLSYQDYNGTRPPQ